MIKKKVTQKMKRAKYYLEVLKMKKSKEYKISIVFFSLCLVSFCIAIITGLMPDLSFSIEKICKCLGFALFALGLVFMTKAKDNNGKEDK